MKRAFAQKLPQIIALICFCLAFGSIASAFMGATLRGMEQQSDLATQSGEAVTFHKNHSDAGHNEAHQHQPLHDCCHEGEGPCPDAYTACSTHCATSAIASESHSILVNPTGYGAEVVLAQPLSVDLDSPFKPPRQ